MPGSNPDLDPVLKAIRRHLPVDLCDLPDLARRFPGISLQVAWPEEADRPYLVAIPRPQASLIVPERQTCRTPIITQEAT